MAIRSFACHDTRRLFDEEWCPPQWRAFERVALRKLAMIDSAVKLDDLRVPPANRLEALKGSLKGRYSIRINDQWRVVFAWHAAGASDVEIIDYH